MSSKDWEDGDSLFGMNMEEWLAQVPVRLITAMTLSKLKLRILAAFTGYFICYRCWYLKVED